MVGVVYRSIGIFDGCDELKAGGFSQCLGKLPMSGE
jgi:hypothetical protein